MPLWLTAAGAVGDAPGLVTMPWSRAQDASIVQAISPASTLRKIRFIRRSSFHLFSQTIHTASGGES